MKDYTDLATKIATLQYSNPDYVLLFRGQAIAQHRTEWKRSSETVIVPIRQAKRMYDEYGGRHSSATSISR